MNCLLFYEVPSALADGAVIARIRGFSRTYKNNLPYCFSLICAEAIRIFFLFIWLKPNLFHSNIRQLKQTAIHIFPIGMTFIYQQP
jgi:hypothetical protein